MTGYMENSHSIWTKYGGKSNGWKNFHNRWHIKWGQVNRLILNSELPATNIVSSNGKLSRKGHYRIKRVDLDKYLESKKISLLSDKPNNTSRLPRHLKVKNHLGL